MWKWLLRKVMNYMVGADVFGKIQSLVSEVAFNEELSGTEKREKVIGEAKLLGEDFATHMLNLAVEAAVTLMREETDKK